MLTPDDLEGGDHVGEVDDHPAQVVQHMDQLRAAGSRPSSAAVSQMPQAITGKATVMVAPKLSSSARMLSRPSTRRITWAIETPQGK